MLKIAVCDDEEYYVQKIKQLIQMYLRKRKVDEFCIDVYLSGLELCEDQEKVKQYEILFLDINMETLNGVSAAERIRKINNSIYVVFVTGYMDFAVEGYRVEAFRYILKDMLETMLTECIDSLLKKMEAERNIVQYQFAGGKRGIKIKNICYIENQKHRQIFYMETDKTKTLHTYSHLDDIEHDLTDFGFIRIHKSFLVNIRYIKNIENYKVALKNGILLPVPRNRYRIVKEQYFVMLGELE